VLNHDTRPTSSHRQSLLRQSEVEFFFRIKLAQPTEDHLCGSEKNVNSVPVGSAASPLGVLPAHRPTSVPLPSSPRCRRRFSSQKKSQSRLALRAGRSTGRPRLRPIPLSLRAASISRRHISSIGRPARHLPSLRWAWSFFHQP
jgi:hypothetical protein